MIEIRTVSGRALYRAESATTVCDAVEEAVRYDANLQGANLRGANLRGANLRGANLRGVDLYVADLRGANLQGANLRGANLYAANLRGANLRGANLYAANLRGVDLYVADLRGANLRGANLRGANLYAANLHGADLHGADLVGADLVGADGITFSAGPSGNGHLIPLNADGKHDRAGEWRITIGCWTDRTLDELRALIADEADWPEASGAERDRRRPYLRAVLALCEAHIAYVGDPA